MLLCKCFAFVPIGCFTVLPRLVNCQFISYSHYLFANNITGWCQPLICRLGWQKVELAPIYGSTVDASFLRSMLNKSVCARQTWNYPWLQFLVLNFAYHLLRHPLCQSHPEICLSTCLSHLGIFPSICQPAYASSFAFMTFIMRSLDLAWGIGSCYSRLGYSYVDGDIVALSNLSVLSLTTFLSFVIKRYRWSFYYVPPGVPKTLCNTKLGLELFGWLIICCGHATR